jgi:hypothetical protein
LVYGAADEGPKVVVESVPGTKATSEGEAGAGS